MAEKISARLERMGVELPTPPKPVASYVGFVHQGELVFVSGQIPLSGGKLACAGIVGTQVSVEQAVAAARICAVNILAQMTVACDGDLEKITRCVRLGGFVASAPDFHDQPRVINGASDFIGEALGDKGAHARAAVGVAALPMNASVEVDAIFAVSG